MREEGARQEMLGKQRSEEGLLRQAHRLGFILCGKESNVGLRKWGDMVWPMLLEGHTSCHEAGAV